MLHSLTPTALSNPLVNLDAPAAVQQGAIVYELLRPESPERESPKTQLCILRSLSAKDVCLIIEARNAAEAIEKANKLATDVTVGYQNATVDDGRRN